MFIVSVFAEKASRLAFVFSLTLCVAALFGSQAPAFAQNQKISADYSINFNGIGIGSFKLASRMQNDKYSIRARARISVLAGILFDWKGDTSSAGRVLADQPRPYSYSFGYRTSDKGETIDVQFANNNVKQIAVNPPQKRSSRRIPVTRKHMRNVIDPLSAVVMLTNVRSSKGAEEVCTRRLPIFDGKARYDLRLTFKKTKRVDTNFGYKGRAHICKVKFVPIAGHKPDDDESRYAAQNEGIEIWMIPLRKADLYVPYYIYIPTPVGNASMTASDFQVETPDGA